MLPPPPRSPLQHPKPLPPIEPPPWHTGKRMGGAQGKGCGRMGMCGWELGWFTGSRCGVGERISIVIPFS